MSQLTYFSTARKIVTGEIQTNLSPLLKRVWPGYAYHFTDFNNAVSILNSGTIVSRQRAIEQNIMKNDNASSDVISHTADDKKRFVRFYHRPKTPTQFHNEGIRSSTTLSNLGSHCPVPIFLLFDLERILNRSDSFFTEKTLARSESINYYSTPEEYASLPFNQIFHDGAYPPEKTEQIKPYRHAEILVADELKIDSYLKKILVRSPNERTMLLRYLNDSARRKYNDIIRIDTRKVCFYGYRTYFQQIRMTDSHVILEINCGNRSSEFDFLIKICNLDSDEVYSFHNENWECTSEFRVNFQQSVENYLVQVYLNNVLVAEDVHLTPAFSDDLPF